MMSTNTAKEDKRRLSDVCRGRVYGRDRELALLQEVLRSVSAADDEKDDSRTFSPPPPPSSDQPPPPPPPALETAKSDDLVEEASRKFVFVHGHSGTGKTKLVRGGFHSAECLFCSGKFEKEAEPSPFYALKTCFGELCSAMATYTNETFDMMYPTLIRSTLEPDEVLIVSRICQNITELVGGGEVSPEEDEENDNENVETSPQTDDLERMRFVLRKFLVAITQEDRPVVMFLDDLQWMDQPTFELLRTLLNNSQLQHFLFVGAYRSDEAEELETVTKRVEELYQPTHRREAVDPVRIHLENLRLEDLGEMLGAALRIKDHETERLESLSALTALLHSRTDGNVFHFLELLDYLQAEKLLMYNKLSFQWMWDLEEIRNHTTLSDNMVQIVTAKIQRLPREVRELLEICGLLGFRLDESLVMAVFQGMVQSSNGSSDVQSLLKVLMDEGLLEVVHGRLKFVHDKVYQAAMALQTNAEERHLKVGRELRKHIDLANVDAEGVGKRALFVSVDQLNMGRSLISGRGEKIDLARLNLAAAKRAADQGGFCPAVRFAEIGFELLGLENRWTNNYELTLALTTTMVQMYAVVGFTEKLFHFSDIVIANAKSVMDKLPIYIALAQAPIAEDDLERGYTTSVNFLKELSVTIPEKPSAIYSWEAFRKLKPKLLAMPDEHILTLPVMTDESKLGAMRILGSLLTVSCLTTIGTEEFIVDAIACCMINLSLSFGRSPDSAAGFAFLGARLAGREESDLAHRCAKLSMMLLNVTKGGDYVRARVLIGTSLTMHWTESLQKLTDHALSAYTHGMKFGDTSSGSFAVLLYSTLYFYSGLALKPLLEDCKTMAAVLSEYGHHSLLLTLHVFEQCISNLLGYSDDILNLNQGSLLELRRRLGWKLGGSGESTESSLRMQIAFYCEEFEVASSMMKQVKANTPGMLTTMWQGLQRVFFYCLIEIHAAREAWSPLATSSHKREAKKHHDQLRDWVVEKGNVNAAHKLLILDAEMKSLKNISSDELKVAYDTAIKASTKAGFLQDGALAAHLASRSLDRHEASVYWKRAVELYNTWGASGVVSYIAKRRQDKGSLEAARRSLIEKPEAGFRGIARFDLTPTVRHKSVG